MLYLLRSADPDVQVRSERLQYAPVHPCVCLLLLELVLISSPSGYSFHWPIFGVVCLDEQKKPNNPNPKRFSCKVSKVRITCI